jgi:apolipoprotein D and lipocalin family protein
MPAQARRLPRVLMALTDDDDLDSRIERAEQAVAERDRRVLRHGRHLVARIERGARLSVGRGLFAAVSALVLAWLLPSRRRTAAVPASGAAGAAPGMQWAALVPLLWPLLPPPLRRRISPGTVALVAGVGVPLLRSLVPQRQALQTAAEVDLARYAGRWYEIARLPAAFEGPGAGDASTTYALRGDHVEIDMRCRGADGRVRSAKGIGYAVEGSRGAKLDISLWPRWLRWLPLAWAGYWIIDVDPGYQHAVVGTPGRKGLWLLARSPQIDQAQYQRMLGIAVAQGFRVDRLQRIRHG